MLWLRHAMFNSCDIFVQIVLIFFIMFHSLDNLVAEFICTQLFLLLPQRSSKCKNAQISARWIINANIGYSATITSIMAAPPQRRVLWLQRHSEYYGCSATATRIMAASPQRVLWLQGIIALVTKIGPTTLIQNKRVLLQMSSRPDHSL